MTAVSRRSASSVSLALIATLVLAGNVAAAPPNWTSPKDIRFRNNVELNDAAFADVNVAISWQEPTSGPPRVGIRTSVDSGSGFGPTQFMAGARESAVDICDESELDVVSAHKIGPGNWFIEHAVGSVDGTGFVTTPVAPTDGLQNNPDVACAGGRVFVSWFEREGTGDRLFVAHARRTGGGFSAPIDLGFDDETSFFSGLAVAGVANRAYATFQRSDGDLRFKRWSVGGAPNFPVSSHPTQVIAPGNANDPASYAVMDAEGSKVAIAWFRCNALYARVSNDRGLTWGPIRKLLDTASCDGDFAAAQSSIAIDGNKIVIAYSAASAFGGGWIGLFRTTNDFASFSDDMITANYHPEHLVGYVTVAGVAKLAAAFERPGVIRFRRQT
jgi:hypothetical protein